MEVGKNTYFKKDLVIYCPRCRIERQQESIRNGSRKGKKDILQLLICEECGKEFASSPRYYEPRYQKYKKHICTSCSKINDKNPFFGKKFTDEQKEMFSSIRSDYYNDAELGNERRNEVSIKTSGENNPMYKGKQYCSNYTWRSKSYREKILNRDDNTCQMCGKMFDTKDLRVHHINSCNWDIDGRTDIDNGITLCSDCHKMFHHFYGYGNNTANQFIDFLEKFRDYPKTDLNYG